MWWYDAPRQITVAASDGIPLGHLVKLLSTRFEVEVLQHGANYYLVLEPKVE